MEIDSQPSIAPTIEACLAQGAAGRLEAPGELWGFGGLHGGLALAATIARIQTTGPAGQLRSVTGHFRQAIREPATIEATDQGVSATTSSYRARLTSQKGTLATATALFGAARRPIQQTFSPSPPAVPSWEHHEVLTFPRELVPVSAQTEIRPVGMSRPFAGGTHPELAAWIRLASDDTHPDALRLIFLLDALAPSYAAVLTTPQPIPTVEISMLLTRSRASSPWVLLSARTENVTEDGWITEHINAWDESGHHLAHAQQLRVIASRSSREQA